MTIDLTYIHGGAVSYTIMRMYYDGELTGKTVLLPLGYRVTEKGQTPADFYREVCQASCDVFSAKMALHLI